jgi:hypothetical protein
MPTHVEVYTLGGIATGVVTRPEHLRDILEKETELLLEDASEAPLDGSPARSGEQSVPVDDAVIVVADEEQPGPVHAVWHPIRLEAGPWLIHGDLPTLPGFDPGRALTRPSGSFVMLRDVRVSLVASPDAGENVHPQALINRYAVDRVDATMMLGFFFPGAHIEAQPAAASPSAGAPAPTPAESPATA